MEYIIAVSLSLSISLSLAPPSLLSPSLPPSLLLSPSTDIQSSRRSRKSGSRKSSIRRARDKDEDTLTKRRRSTVTYRQFPNENLVLLNQLGDGEYGPVYRGKAYGLDTGGNAQIVTVKMLKMGADEEKRLIFQQEIALFSSINHLNVVSVLGVCTNTSPECIIFDASDSHIDLLTFVRQKGKAMAGVKSGARIVEDFRSLLQIADEICLGLAYLSSQQIVHKDVALRNCIRGHNGVVKVSSFGLGPQLYPEAYYQLGGQNLPLRWMSPEAINYNTLTTESDIWAFGVLMWELFTYGDHPFSELSDQQVISQVARKSIPLSQPDKCPDDVFLVMLSCWEIQESSRPSFFILHKHIFDLVSPELMEHHGD